MNSNLQLMHPVRRCYIINKVFFCVVLYYILPRVQCHIIIINLYAVVIIPTIYTSGKVASS